METTLQGKLITDGRKIQRVYYSNSFQARTVLCSVDGVEITQLVLETFETSALWNLIHTGKYEFVDEAEPPLLDVSNFDEKARIEYEKNTAFISDVRINYGNEYVNLISQSKKECWEELLKKHAVNRAVGWKLVRRYLQSGLRPSSLIDRRKLPKNKNKKAGTLKSNPGLPSASSYVLTSIDIDHMDAIIREFLKNEVGCKEDYYCKLLTDYYLDENGAIKDKVPSRKQFLYHLNTTIPFDVQEKRKVDSAEARNNFRAKLGNPGLIVQRAGQIIEIDECELCVLIVSSIDRRQIIGKPILYLAVDVFSHAIVGLSILLHNNSFMGMSSLFLNMFEGSETYLKRLGITEGWQHIPSGFCPEMIRSDQGAEYTSYNFEEFCKELGAAPTLLPVKQGSMKGTVERKFGFIQSFLSPHLKDRGLIRNTYGSNHYETARYTIEEITKICIDIAIYYNSHKVDKFPARSRAMSLAVGKVPEDMWKYSIEHFGAPFEINSANRNEYFYKCLIKTDAVVSEKGITVAGLSYYENISYINTIINRAAIDGKSKSIKVGIDPRDVEHIYYNADGHIIPVPLLKEKMGYDYGNTAWTEYLMESEIIKEREKADDIQKTKDKALLHKKIEDTLSSVEVPRHKPKKGGIPEARNEERMRMNAEERVFDRMRVNDRIPLNGIAEDPPMHEIADAKTEDIQKSAAKEKDIDYSSLSLDEISALKQGSGLSETIRKHREIDI